MNEGVPGEACCEYCAVGCRLDTDASLDGTVVGASTPLPITGEPDVLDSVKSAFRSGVVPVTSVPSGLTVTVLLVSALSTQPLEIQFVSSRVIVPQQIPSPTFTALPLLLNQNMLERASTDCVFVGMSKMPIASKALLSFSTTSVL